MEKNKEFAQYFTRLLLEKEPMTPQYKVAEKFGVQQGTISKLKSGAMIPSDDLAKKMVDIWGIDPTEVMEVVYKTRKESGARFFRESQERAEVEAEETVKPQTKPRLPVSAAAGSLSQYSEGVMLEQCEQMPVIRNFPDYDYTMFIKGNSMEPKYESGDEVAIKKAEFVIEWGKDYVLDTADGVLFKKIYEEGENIRCVSYNHDEYPDFLVPKKIIYGYYKLVGLVRV